MELASFLDSTYLKTPSQAHLSEEDTEQEVVNLVNDAITYKFKLVMIRAHFIVLAKELIHKANSAVKIGTVIGFHGGTDAVESKLEEAKNAIRLGVDELDFVVNYKAFVSGDVDLVIDEVYQGTQLGLKHNKIVKWIIEVAALTPPQIAELSSLIKNIVIEHFGAENTPFVFVKSSTGFFNVEAGKPNGATVEAVKIMIKNAFPLPVKAAGGVKSKKDALKMITLGVQRIGTSSAKEMIENKNSNSTY